MLYEVITLLFCLFITYSSCENKNQTEGEQPLTQQNTIIEPVISREVYHDKVLGLLVGSAIGDAMGAPTEMWSRNDIQLDYGFDKFF